jgi:hypothetical protein
LVLANEGRPDRGRKKQTDGVQAAHPRRSATHRCQNRQAARAVEEVAGITASFLFWLTRKRDALSALFGLYAFQHVLRGDHIDPPRAALTRRLARAPQLHGRANAAHRLKRAWHTRSHLLPLTTHILAETVEERKRMGSTRRSLPKGLVSQRASAYLSTDCSQVAIRH